MVYDILTSTQTEETVYPTRNPLELIEQSEKADRVSSIPYIVLVLATFQSSHLKGIWKNACTGTLVSQRLVLTTATCLIGLIDGDLNVDNVEVYDVGSSHRLPTLKIYIHPNYYIMDQEVANSYDYALVLTDGTAETSFPNLPTDLQDFDEVKEDCFIAGYGGTEGVGKRNFRVQRLNSSEVYEIGCDLSLCLTLHTISPCRGDMGSPVICGGVLYAMFTPNTQFDTRTCKDVYINVFSYVYRAVDWIDATESSLASDLSWMTNPWNLLLLVSGVMLFMFSIYCAIVQVLKKFDRGTEDCQQTGELPSRLPDKLESVSSLYI